MGKYIRELEICDDDGIYTKLQRVTHRLIDATCIRVCKSFYAIGSDMLYKQNAFAFDDASNWKNAPGDQYPLEIRSLMLDQQKLRQYLDSAKPGLKPGYSAYKRWLHKMDEVISQMQRPVPARELKGWAYFDPLLRFLFTVHQRNASLLKTFKVSGEYSNFDTHDYRSFNRCGSCYKSLNAIIFPYIQVINKLCPGLQKLVLKVRTGRFTWTDENAREEAVLKRLISHLKKLKTVKQLVLYISQEGHFKFRPMKSRLALETTRCFDDRARGRMSKN